MKKTTLFAAFLSLAASAFAAIPGPFSKATDIDDLALIYIGSQHRPDWTKETFRPYVMHTYADGTQSWMFDGFLMIEFLAYNEAGRQVSLGETAASVEGAKRSDWERLLKVQLGTETGQGCRALDDLIDELIPVLGEPGHKHKVVLSLPIAEAKSDIWGEVNGVRLDFNKSEDRTTGMKWYADLIESEWRKMRFKHLDLDGIYWTNETFYGRDEAMVRKVNEYYHAKKKKVYWIPYLTRYRSEDNPEKYGKEAGDLTVNQSADSWADFGVDVCYVQAGYYFQDNRPYDYLLQATDYAWDHYGVGVEFEFEGYNYVYDPKTKTRSRITPSNCGLYDVSPVFYNRFKAYIDAYEEELMFKFKPLSYYSGFQAIYDFVNSGNRMDALIIDRLAKLMNERHIESGWDKKPSATGIEDIVASADIDVHATDGAIFISSDTAAPFGVYSLDGVCVAASHASDALSAGVTVPCSAGIYVVRVGDKSFKVSVR